MRKGQEITPKVLCEEIADERAQYAQWYWPDAISHRYEHYFRLTTLVELLEVYDCGSVGGFGEGQPENQNLFQRAQWLAEKYSKGTTRS